MSLFRTIAGIAFVSIAGAFGQPMQVVDHVIGGGSVPAPTGGLATSAPLVYPTAVTVDPAGNLYVGDTYFSQVYKIDKSGNLSLFAGIGIPGYIGGDDQAATGAFFSGPQSLAADSLGNIYLLDPTAKQVRQITTDGVIHTYAGMLGAAPGTGDGQPAVQAGFSSPQGLAFDSSNNLYISDSGNGGRSIRKVSASNPHIITKIAGIYGVYGIPDNGQPAASDSLYTPGGLTVDPTGNIFFADVYACEIFDITGSGILNAFAGGSFCGYSGSPDPFSTLFYYPESVAWAPPGNLYITDYGNSRIRMIANNQVSTVVGTGNSGYNGDNRAGASAQIAGPLAIAADSSGNVYFTEVTGHRVRKLAPDQTVSTVAGTGVKLPLGDGGPATSAVVFEAAGVVSDGKGTFYVSDIYTNTIRKITPDGKIATIAGTGLPGYNGDNLPALQAQLNQPYDLALDSAGNLYIADSGNCRIRMVNSAGVISSVVGGTCGDIGDNIPANQAYITNVTGIAIDAQGTLYIADSGNHRLRVVSGGIISSIAGVSGQSRTLITNDSGDGGLATNAVFESIAFVAVDGNGNIYTGDVGSCRVRKISKGVITAFAGVENTCATSGDGRLATGAALNGIYGLAVDTAGNVWISTYDRIREVTPDGIIHTPIGGGTEYEGLNGQLAGKVQVQYPVQLWAAPDGTMYYAAQGDNGVYHYHTGQISEEAVQNIADFSGGNSYVAPGELIILYGDSLGPASLTTPVFDSNSTGFPTNIAGTEVLFDNVQAPLLYVESAYLACIVPFEVAGKSVTNVQVSVNGKLSNVATLHVTPVLAGVWPSIVNANGSINGPNNPATANDVVSFYLSGAGVTSPALSDGQFVFDNTHTLVAPVVVTMGGETAAPVYAGAAPYSVAGQAQVSVRVPAGISGSAVPVSITVNGIGVTTRNITIAVH